MREGDDEVAVLVDALDGALDTFEGASEETDALTLTTEKIGIGQEVDGHELHVGAVAIEHLQLAQLGAVGIDEDEIVDQRLHGVDELLADTLCDAIHGEEVLHTFLVEGIANLNLTTVSDVHRIPSHLFL